MTKLSPAEEAFYDALDKARERAHNPTMAAISRMAGEKNGSPVPVKTVSGWFKREHLPRDNETGHSQLFAVAAALHSTLDWLPLLQQAHKGRNARLAAPGGARPRRLAVSSLVAIVVIAGILGVILLVIWVRGPQPACAIVTVDEAAVWTNLDQAPLKYKREGDQVKLYTAKDPKETPDGIYQPVHLSEGGWGWMRQADLEETGCSVQ